jgi:Tfp pilus assembly protein PilZ
LVQPKLKLRFESAAQLQAEFDKNIANGGVFVPSEETFELRQSVTVDMEMAFSAGGPTTLALDGEIVHQIPREMAGSGVEPGVAVQFEASAQALRDHFLPLLDPKRATLPLDADVESARRRSSRRNPIRVPVRVMPMSSHPFDVTSRDLSASGILLSLRDEVLPVGEVVCICLWHPNGESSVEIDGQVVREVKNKSGRIAAVAVAFDRRQAADPQVAKVISALRRAGHQSQLGGISGSIGELGVGNLLQMFGSSAPRGTLVVERDAEQGFVAFSEECFLSAELGSQTGIEALMELLEWGEGRFEFEATVSEALLNHPDRMPLTAALLEAARRIDESEAARSDDGQGGAIDPNEITLGSLDASLDAAFGDSGDSGDGIPEHANDANAMTTVMSTPFLEADTPSNPPISWLPGMTFVVDPDREEAVRSGLGKSEEATLDLAKAGMTLQKMLEIIPETPDRIQGALELLVDLSVLRPR